MSLSSFFSFLGCNGSSKHATLNYPPFKIEKRTVTERRFKINEGTTSTSTYTKYKVFYQDQLISFPSSLDEGTGVAGIWKAYFLKDAPVPALLIASKNAFLITEENGAAKLSIIEKKHANYSSVQWLDSENGQPGPKTEILIREDTTDCSLDGGKFLLVNEHTVLNIEDLSTSYFNRRLDYTDDYYPGSVMAFSPDKKQIAFLASKRDRSSGLDYIYALLVYHYQGNQVYVVPFDKTETRFQDPYNIRPNWVETYFEWNENEDGQHVLSKKELSQLPNWEGHFTKNHSYQLDPVSEGMHSVFFNFAKSYLQFNDADITTEEFGSGKQYEINHEGFVFNIRYSKDFSTASLSLSFLNKGSEDEANALIKKVGDAFNDVLRQGEHQEFFTNY